MEVFILLLVFFLYFLPTIIAVKRKKPNTGAIILINVFLGWALIGWIIALMWAITAGGKTCPYCVKTVAERATICPHCQKELSTGKETGAKE